MQAYCFRRGVNNTLSMQAPGTQSPQSSVYKPLSVQLLMCCINIYTLSVRVHLTLCFFCRDILTVCMLYRLLQIELLQF